MFNLIVSGGLENGRSGSIIAGRVFEYTDDEIGDRFRRDGRLDIPALTTLPTIFMEEGVSDEIVGIGWLSRVELRGDSYHYFYAVDPDVPLMTNADIYALASELRIHDWEFSRNHWAIKDVDLFHVLYRQKAAQRPVPTVFQLSEKPIRPNLISMMMPFSEGFSRVYQTVKTALEAEGYECTRADDFWINPHIIQDIIELICTSSIVICDLSDKNPNVFYETGIAHTLGKEVILITQSMNDVPFDLRSLRCITYLNNQEGCNNLAGDIVGRLRTIA